MPIRTKPDLSSVDRAKEIEARLKDRFTALAEELGKPAHARSGQRLIELWNHADELRPALGTAMRAIKAAEGPHRTGLPRDEKRARNLLRSARLGLKRRMAVWEQMCAMVRRHIAPEPEPLFPEGIPVEGDPLTELLAKTLHQVANPEKQGGTAHDHGCFADIPLPVRKFDALMLAAYRLMLARGKRDGVRFLDVGCGGGTKLVIARRYFSACHGLEYDKGYVEEGTRFLDKLGRLNMTIEHADALAYTGYDAFDIIYFYRPMRTDDRLAELERQVMRHARPGTLVLAPYDEFLAVRRGFDGLLIAPPIYGVGLSQAEADAWRADAERTDTRLVARSHKISFEPGFWKPLFEVSSFDFHTS
ncbi:MAG: class I SAM-dependent methyltransferase [Pseudomonadota bacterium]